MDQKYVLIYEQSFIRALIYNKYFIELVVRFCEYKSRSFFAIFWTSPVVRSINLHQELDQYFLNVELTLVQ